MPAHELDEEIAAGVVFWGSEIDGELVGIMGVQPVGDVDLIRHAYVSPDRQGQGVGGALLEELAGSATRPCLVGTWAAADWAIRFYRRHGFEQVSPGAQGCSGATGRSRTVRSRRRLCCILFRERESSLPQS